MSWERSAACQWGRDALWGRVGPFRVPAPICWGVGEKILSAIDTGGDGANEWAKVWPWWLLFVFLTLLVSWCIIASEFVQK